MLATPSADLSSTALGFKAFLKSSYDNRNVVHVTEGSFVPLLKNSVWFVVRGMVKLGALFRNRFCVSPMTTTSEIPRALPSFEVVDALIKRRANADTLNEHGGSQADLGLPRRLIDAPLPPVPQTNVGMAQEAGLVRAH